LWSLEHIAVFGVFFSIKNRYSPVRKYNRSAGDAMKPLTLDETLGK
jgi:hypothetical protein